MPDKAVTDWLNEYAPKHQQEGWASTAEIAKAWGMSMAGTKRRLVVLEEKGEWERQDPVLLTNGKSGAVWRVKPK